MSHNLKVVRGAVETHKHIDTVRENLSVFIKELLDRSNEHDKSKLESPEVEIIGECTARLSGLEYGSPEYVENLRREMKPALDHHYAHNRHHPEFHKNGINDMDILDLCELLCDWVAATKRNKNGNIRKSLEINADRYGINPQLTKIFNNTIDRYF